MKKISMKPVVRKFLTAFLFYLCIVLSAQADNQSGIKVGEEDRCPVCAMKVIRYPKFACTMELEDGRKFSFCAAGCMIRSWLHPEIYLKAEKSDIRKVWVQDYFTGQTIDGSAAFWVAGSDVVGPMGPTVVPLKSEADVESFKKRHGGKSVFHLKDLKDEKWNEINGKQ